MNRINVDNILISENTEWIGYNSDRPINMVSYLFDSEGNRRTNCLKTYNLPYGDINLFNTVYRGDKFVTIEVLSAKRDDIALKIEFIDMTGNTIHDNKRNINKVKGVYKEFVYYKGINSYILKELDLEKEEAMMKCIYETEKEVIKMYSQQRLKICVSTSLIAGESSEYQHSINLGNKWYKVATYHRFEEAIESIPKGASIIHGV